MEWKSIILQAVVIRCEMLSHFKGGTTVTDISKNKVPWTLFEGKDDIANCH